MDPIIVTAVAVILNKSLSLLALWLRLRRGIQWEHAHRRNLVTIIKSIPEGGQVSERRADGAHLVITRANAKEQPGG